MTQINVLYEDNHLLAVLKPAMLPTMGVAADKPSLLNAARKYIKRKYRKPGNVYLGTLSRLDAPVTGVVLFARTSKAASRLSEQIRQLTVGKSYWALVNGLVEPAKAECVDWVRKDERHRRMHITTKDAIGAKQARLGYQTLSQLKNATLLEIALHTGRKHQIRLQLAHRDFPVLGDRKYGGKSIPTFPDGIALHARKMIIDHPVTRQRLTLEAPLPPSWFEWDDGTMASIEKF